MWTAGEPFTLSYFSQECLYLLGPSQGCLLKFVVTVLRIGAYCHPWKRKGGSQSGVNMWDTGTQKSNYKGSGMRPTSHPPLSYIAAHILSQAVL